MSENYDAMVKWLDYEAANKASHGGNIPGLGDWESAQSTTAQAIIDYGYYDAVNTMAKVAQVLGKTSDAAKYSALATSLSQEYNAKYLHTDSAGHAWYANNTGVPMPSPSMPAWYPPSITRPSSTASWRRCRRFNTGIGTGSVALGPLFRALHDAGRDDLIYQMVTNPNGPSYAFLVNQGATTLWENLNGSGGSHDHQFLGDVAAWFVHDVIGIDQPTGSTESRTAAHQAGRRRWTDPRRRQLHHAAGTCMGQLGEEDRRSARAQRRGTAQHHRRDLGAHLRQAGRRAARRAI